MPEYTAPPYYANQKGSAQGRAAKAKLEFTDEPSTVALLLSSGVSRSCITTHSLTNSDSQPDLNDHTDGNMGRWSHNAQSGKDCLGQSVERK